MYHRRRLTCTGCHGSQDRCCHQWMKMIIYLRDGGIFCNL
jgi:hypothetical protein